MYLLPSKRNKKGMAPVYCRVKYLGKPINLSTDVFIDSILWDKKKGKVKSKHTNYVHLNLHLREVEEKINSIYNALKNEHPGG